ncbi:Elongator complex protein 1 [Frankliniella fusca]|uniref:Elongator complex protein 1 n=1 Tax=Frankliniella fusca TaxID=407009 RepID=A0AAE1LP81_9NEOP|nr:Elongator complex protein 1 [Frankliniella fusca]
MRNLFVNNVRDFAIPGLKIVRKPDNLLVVDHLRNAIIVHSGGIVYRFSTEDDSLIELFRVDHYYPKEDGTSPSIVSMCYFQLTDSLCLAVDKGELLSLNCAVPQEVECVGFVESGLRLMEASPDEDVLVLLTSQNTVITMTASFDPINETDLQQAEFGEKQFITVGWGKKETQFHGSEGKAAALAKPSAQSSEPSKFDEGSPQITWRGDGALFAVNCINEATGDRFVRIFDRKGDLMYTSENIPGLEGALSWKPSGNLMACSQRMPNKHVICFLEKNGLRHGDFTLPFPLDSVLVRQLLWNAESTLLLVWCQIASEGTPPAGLVGGQSTLLLWTINNYHWYLKQRIDLNLDNSPVAVRWDPDSGNRLHVVCSGGKYISYDFSWRVDHSSGSNHYDGAFVSVIDGDSLLVTSFRYNVIPPPMCGTTLKLPAPAKEVVFAPQHAPTSIVKELEGRYLNTSSTEDSGFGDVVESLSSNPNNFCVVLCNGMLAAFSYVGGPRSLNPSHSLVGIYHLAWQDENQMINSNYLHHWTWVSRDSMVCSTAFDGQAQLCVFDIDSLGSTDNGRVVLKKIAAVPGSNVISIVPSLVANTIILQLVEGRVLSFSLESDTFLELFTFPHPVYKMMACRLDKDCGIGQEIIFGLSTHNRLYANTDVVMGSVTSFSLHSKFLLLTTSQQQLFCCPLKKMSVLNLSKSAGDNGSFGVVERKVERGSRLIVVVPDGNRVILQMPRGNLECIEPRALSLSQMANLLNTQAYYEAFDLARKQRINLNLFVDHDPDLFFRNIELFVKRVSNPQWLCLFLADLHDEDCTTSMYKSHYPDHASTSLSNKVDAVCDAFLAAVEKLGEKDESDSQRLTLPVLTALVLKRSSDGLEAALSLIKNLKESEEKSESSVSWTVALRHLLYLRDVNQLMDAALGMYDFNLVVLIASKSQKDPKEYLAFLNKLRQMEENYQRYSVDKHLRKWESALVNLIKSPGDHKLELLNFVINQDLYREALTALPQHDQRFRLIASAYADKLVSQRLYKEAAIMYRRARDFHNALLSHQKALAWRNCIEDAIKIGLNDDERKEILSELATALEETGQFGEAVVIYLHYLNKPLLAMQALCSAHLWTEAIRVALFLRRTEFIDLVVQPRAEEYADEISLQIKTFGDTFSTHTSRLFELRREKVLAHERLLNQDGDTDGCVENDLLSDTSSVTGSSVSSKGSSSHSSSSNRSSKNRRKQERKVLSLKRGSPHEELALIYALHQCITSSFALREDVYSLNCILVDFDKDCDARDLQTLLSGILSRMEASISKIWPVQSVQQTYGPNATSNMLASTMTSAISNNLDLSLLEPIYRFAPVIRPMKWELEILKSTRK